MKQKIVNDKQLNMFFYENFKIKAYAKVIT